jgi:hypothetical protein
MKENNHYFNEKGKEKKPIGRYKFVVSVGLPYLGAMWQSGLQVHG